MDEQTEERLLMVVKGYYGWQPTSSAHVDRQTGKVYIGSNYAGYIINDELVLDRVRQRVNRIPLSFFRKELPEENQAHG